MAPYASGPGWELLHGDCIEAMRGMAEASVDAIVCDPPYDLTGVSRNGSPRQNDPATPYGRTRLGGGFMGKTWDATGIAFDPATWAEALRVLRPGGHILAFGGTRTYHRLACAIEDAGFEVRDQLQWLYGSGFPKSADISKHLDAQERNRWLNVCKALDNFDQSAILEAWEEHSSNAKPAALTFVKSQTETGTNTPKSGFVPGSAPASLNREKSKSSAPSANRPSSAAHLTGAASSPSALSHAEPLTTALSAHATNAEPSPESRAAMPDMPGSSALFDAWDSPAESLTAKLKAGEALKIWLGSKPSSKQANTAALCAALTDDWKLITEGRLRTSLNCGTTSLTACASATPATITASTAASLISFTVATLKRKAIDKAAGAEREVTDYKPRPDGTPRNHEQWATVPGGGARVCRQGGAERPRLDSLPATPEAAAWNGWGTALKPSHEPICLARKPLAEGTVAANVLAWGTGGINVDGCRIGTDERTYGMSGAPGGNGVRLHGGDGRDAENARRYACESKSKPPVTVAGRWPANVCLDEEAVRLLDEQAGVRHAGGAPKRRINEECRTLYNRHWNGQEAVDGIPGSTGGASRFFYCAKASRSERNAGLGDPGPARKHNELVPGIGITGAALRPSGSNTHPTVKPIALMRWLCRLITPPGGLILDPFTGSGSTGLAAIAEGFRFIGIEREAEYLEIATRRLNAASPLKAAA